MISNDEIIKIQLKNSFIENIIILINSKNIALAFATDKFYVRIFLLLEFLIL